MDVTVRCKARECPLCASTGQIVYVAGKVLSCWQFGRHGLDHATDSYEVKLRTRLLLAVNDLMHTLPNFMRECL